MTSETEETVLDLEALKGDLWSALQDVEERSVVPALRWQALERAVTAICAGTDRLAALSRAPGASREDAREYLTGCDANKGGPHAVETLGRYHSCRTCGETITNPTLSEKLRLAEARARKAEKELAALSPPSTGGEGETGWLIEGWNARTGKFKAHWWGLGDAFEEGFGWTTNSDKALRFAREIDAQEYIVEAGWTDAKPTEHVWPSKLKENGLSREGLGGSARASRGAAGPSDCAENDQPSQGGGIKVGQPMPYYCPACQAIPRAGYCKLAGCPTGPQNSDGGRV